MLKTLPHLLNVNEDPQLTGVLKYFIQAGTHPDPPSHYLPQEHASFLFHFGKTYVTSDSPCSPFLGMWFRGIKHTHTLVQPSPPALSRTSSSSRTKTRCPLNTTSRFSAPAPGGHHPSFCL